MKKIIVRNIVKKQNSIQYEFHISKELERFFSGKQFVIEYGENIESVPDSIAIVPFVCNVLPIIWLTDSILIIDEIDKDFYDCIPNVKSGYQSMFPESEFKGGIVVDIIVDNERDLHGNSAMFYSGGLDSAFTLINHMEEQPILLSIWGSDIGYDNKDGWDKVHFVIKKVAEQFALKQAVIRSSFRVFDNEAELGKQYSAQLKDGWWHGVKHGIGLLGHVAPYAYLHQIEKMYIASTYTSENIRCASSPKIDNYMRFCGCEVFHDGFEYSRQQKVKAVVEFAPKEEKELFLHVCWQTQTGTNCCRCEKCYRTIMALLAEGADPAKYGFQEFEKSLKHMKYVLLGNDSLEHYAVLKGLWVDICNRLKQNKNYIKRKTYYSQIKWLLKINFEQPEKIKKPWDMRLRGFLSKYKFYQKLYVIKKMIIKGK